MTLCVKKENLVRKENNGSIEERFNENNNVRNEDISVKFNNNNINNKIIIYDTKANPINEGHHEIVNYNNNCEFNPIYNLIKLFNNNIKINNDVSNIYNNIDKQMESEEKNEKSDKIVEDTKLLNNNNHANLDESIKNNKKAGRKNGTNESKNGTAGYKNTTNER